MTRPPSRPLPLVVPLLAAGVIVGCASRRPAPALVPGDDGAPVPKVTRIELALDERRLQLFSGKLAPFWAEGVDPERSSDFFSFADSTSPFESFVHDERTDRFIVPGIWSLSRSGSLSFHPPPLAAGPEVPLRGAAELRAALRSVTCPLLVAVDQQPESVMVLCVDARPARGYPSHRYRRGLNRPDSIFLVRLDPRHDLRELDFRELRIAGAWDAWSTVKHFLESGEVVVALAERSVYIPGRGPVSRPPRSRHPTLRIDPRGRLEVIRRGCWLSAEVTKGGDVIGVVRRFGGAALLGLDRDGGQRFRVELEQPGIVKAHQDGVCVLASASPVAGATIGCFDRKGQLRWRRHTPGSVTDWMVDDAGWAYLVATYEGAQRPTIVAVSPEGSIAWSLPGAPPKGGMMAAGDDLCFVAEAGKEPSAVPPELVCIGPRHGWK